MGIIEKYIMSFWQGKLKLWHSFWLVGGVGGIIFGQIMMFFEKNLFGMNPMYPFDFSFRSKIFVLIWVIFTTVGIWRSAENYNGAYFLKIITKGKYLWLRNNLSTFSSSLIDNTIFSLLAWIILNPNPLALYVVITTYILGTYILRIIIAIIDTPFIYLSKYFLPKNYYEQF